MKYLVKDVYETIDTAVPFTAWCRKNGLDPEGEVSQKDRIRLIMRSKNQEAKDEVIDKTCCLEDRFAVIQHSRHCANNTSIEGMSIEEGSITITSRAMATILGSQHKDVLYSIDSEIKLLKNLVAEVSATTSESEIQRVLSGFYLSSYEDARGRSWREYILKEEAALQIAAKHSPLLRARIVCKFIDLRREYTKYLEAATLALGDPALRPLPRKIYLLWDDVNELTKIGIAKDPESRLAQGRTFCQSLDLVWESPLATNAAAIEASAHKHFKDSCKFGEWFEIKPQEALDFLKTQEFLLSI